MRAPAARRPCSGGAHSVQPSWILRSDHSSARGESARRSDDSSRGIQSWERHAEESPLHHCGHLETSTRAESADSNGSTRYSIRSTDARVRSKRQLLGLSDPDVRPDVHWLPVEASAVIAWQGNGCARDSEEAIHRIGLCTGCPAGA